VPYLLLGVLTLGAGLGVGLGLSEATSASPEFSEIFPFSLPPGQYTLSVPKGTECHRYGLDTAPGRRQARQRHAGILYVCTHSGAWVRTSTTRPGNGAKYRVTW
jgi:hypothetical protein